MEETILQDRYRLEEELGRGGMGVVYRAQDTLLHRNVAIKLVSAAGLGSEGRTRLLHEAQAAASLSHPNIVAVHDAGIVTDDEEQGESAFIVMELVDGQPLSDFSVSGLEEALAIGRQIAMALETAHNQGIIHRDLKPENVIVSSRQTEVDEPVRVQVKLMDFGLARITGRTQLTQDGAVVGTLAYLPPEIIQGQSATVRSDLYSLGILLYELVTGRLPFEGDSAVAVLSQHLHATVATPSVYNDTIPPDLDGLILELLQKEPARRPASAAEVARALGALQRGQPVIGIAAVDPLNRLVRGRLVGRDRELAEAQEMWQQTLASNGQTLLISGEPGIGKTSLVRELRTLVEATGGQGYIGACYPESGAPYAPFAQIVQRALRRSDGDLALPEFVMAEMLSLAPELQMDYPDVQPNPPLDPEAGQRRLFDSLVVFSRVLSQQRPLLLVLEDAHWADDGSLTLLRRLARRGRQQSMLIVVTYREIELDRNLPFNQALMELQREQLANRIKLTRLDRQATERLLSQLFNEEITPDFLEGIYRETEGNPFFIEEVCKALVESGELYFEDGIWHRPEMDKLAIPQSVRVAIQSRVAVLEEELQDMLRLAAIIGREFDYDTLEAAGSWDEESLIDALEQAERAQLIKEVSSERGATFAFLHALIPSTLVEGLSGLRQRRMHRQVAQVIEELRPDDWVALANHYRLAEDREKAIYYLEKAADRAQDRYAHEDAVRFCTQALEFARSDEERFILLEQRASAYHLMADRDVEWNDIEDMLEITNLLDDDSRRIDALLAQARYHLETEHVRTQEPAGQAAQLARKLADPVREARALSLSGRANRFSANDQQSRQDLETAADQFQKAGMSAEAAAALHSLSLTLVSLGENEAALEAAMQALALSREAGDKLQEASSLRRVAIAHGMAHRHEEALPYAQQALALHRQLGDRAEEANALNVLGIIFNRLDEPDRAFEYYRESLELAEEIESSIAIQYAIFNAAYYLATDNHYEQALEFMREEAEKHAGHPDKWLDGSLHYNQAIFLYLMGQYREAIEAMDRSNALLEGIWSPANEAGNLAHTAMIHAESGEWDEVEQLVRRSEEAAGRAGKGDNLDFYYLWISRIHLLAGKEMEAGLEAAEQALAFARQFGNDFVKVQSLSLKARLHQAQGQLAPMEEAVDELLSLMDLREGNLRRQELLWTVYRARMATGKEEEAREALQEAYSFIRLIADEIQDDGLRQDWLEKVAENPRITAEAKKMGLIPIPGSP